MIVITLQVDVDQLHPGKMYIQISHVVPYFTAEELAERYTKFEQENHLSRFVYETPFTTTGKAHGSVVDQWIKRTILTSMQIYFCITLILEFIIASHWFPYILKKIPVIHEEYIDLSPIEVR